MRVPAWLNTPDNELTAPETYYSRRQFMRHTALGALGMGLAHAGLIRSAQADPSLDAALTTLHPDDTLTSFKDVTSYNNYYEFSTNKEAIRVLAREFTTRPWTVTVGGEVENPRVWDIDALTNAFAVQERVYRLRCVEGWSMVVPWTGFALSEFIKQARPTSRAKFVEFVSVLRPEEMIGQRRQSLQWPYREALRIDEATHPLTFMASGLYGQDLPAQNGAPLRLVVPWKYGYKSIKAVAHINFLSSAPATTWPLASPSEYGFYANVNPDVSSPKWSQRREVRIGEVRKRRTALFNGYAESVAHLYRGMDLHANP
jgi:sulfoxide reductase catalytic subunit YedY